MLVNGPRSVFTFAEPAAQSDTQSCTQMRALFAEENAFVFTTWSGGVPIDEFINISEVGFGKGVKIAVSSRPLFRGRASG